MANIKTPYEDYSENLREYIEKFDGETVTADPNGGLTFDPTDTGKAKAVTITDAYSNTDFNAGAYSTLVTINGSGRTNPIKITGNTLKNRISSGSGADTLSGGDGNDTMSGGGGADVFITSQGKDIITDYSASEGDQIQLMNVTPTKVKVSKQNVVITNNDKSTFTLQNAKGITINAIDANGNVINALNQAFGDTEFTANSGTAVVDASLNTSLKKIDASEAKGSNYKTATQYSVSDPGLSEGISLVGNTSANTIIGSNYINNTIYGGTGKDVLIGGSGTQVSVTGSNGSNQVVPVGYIENTFVFTEGNGANTISNYQDHDRIWVKSGSVTGYTIKKNDVVLTVALNNKKKSTITVQDAKNKTITILTNNGTIDTANTKVYRDATDYIITTEASVTSAQTGDKVKLIDASSEYASLIATSTNSNGVETKIYRNTPVSQKGYGTDGVYIEGNKIANTIKGSKYNDTITGGAGKDTIFGGHDTTLGADFCQDRFIYTVGDAAVSSQNLPISAHIPRELLRAPPYLRMLC